MGTLTARLPEKKLQRHYYAQWEGNKRERATIVPNAPHCPSRAAVNPTTTTAPSIPHCPNTAAPPCTHMSPSILSAAMALIACCTQPRTLEQMNERKPEAQGSRDREMSGSHEDGTGTTLQWCASISNEPMSGNSQDTQRTSNVHSEPMHHRNNKEKNHKTSESTVRAQVRERHKRAYCQAQPQEARHHAENHHPKQDRTLA